MTFRWRLNPKLLGVLHQKYAPQYRDVLLAPTVGSITRHVVSSFLTEDLVSERLYRIQQEVFRNARSRSDQRLDDTDPVYLDLEIFNHTDGVILPDDILFAEMILPANVRQSIEEKLRQAQVVEEFRFRVQREELKSQRKAVEAEGIRRFQQIVAANMSDAYLRWRGIEATLELARSTNSKMVVIGNQQSGGLPLILDGADRTPQAAEKPDAPAPTKAP